MRERTFRRAVSKTTIPTSKFVKEDFIWHDHFKVTVLESSCHHYLLQDREKGN